MDDDLFTDELELDERRTDQQPRVSSASQPIRDGSRALLHDGYDVQLFHDAAGEYPKLAELIATSRERLITAPALICDLFWSFFKHAPGIRPVVPLTPAHQLHADILEQLMATREWHAVRAAESALGALSAAVVAEINHLRELFAQAAKARAEAAELARAEEQAAAELADQAEQIEDATRRAARAGMRAAAEQIEDATAAIKTFGGGYGPGIGLENGALTTREKIALVSQVGRPRRHKQVAARCPYPSPSLRGRSWTSGRAGDRRPDRRRPRSAILDPLPLKQNAKMQRY